MSKDSRIMVPGRITIADPPGITALRATANRSMPVEGCLCGLCRLEGPVSEA